VRLHLESGLGGVRIPAELWLPLALAPDAEHGVCPRLRESEVPARIRGEVLGAGGVHRFTVTPGGSPEPLRPDR